jgi:hypothetical protein
MCLTAYPRSNEERLPLVLYDGLRRVEAENNRKRNAAAGIAAIANSVYTLARANRDAMEKLLTSTRWKNYYLLVHDGKTTY